MTIGFGGRRRCTRRDVLGASLLLGTAVLAGCGARQAETDADALVAWPAEDRWPERFRQAPVEVQEAYRFAVTSPDVLQWMPCFCGCGGQGHASNLDCHVAERRGDGSVLLDAMGFN